MGLDTKRSLVYNGCVGELIHLQINKKCLPSVVLTWKGLPQQGGGSGHGLSKP